MRVPKVFCLNACAVIQKTCIQDLESWFELFVRGEREFCLCYRIPEIQKHCALQLSHGGADINGPVTAVPEFFECDSVSAFLWGRFDHMTNHIALMNRLGVFADIIQKPGQQRGIDAGNLRQISGFRIPPDGFRHSSDKGIKTEQLRQLIVRYCWNRGLIIVSQGRFFMESQQKLPEIHGEQIQIIHAPYRETDFFFLHHDFQ